MGLMSVAKLQVSLVRLVRSTMLELLPLCLFMDFCELTKPDSISPNQIGTPLPELGCVDKPLLFSKSTFTVSTEKDRAIERRFHETRQVSVGRDEDLAGRRWRPEQR